MTRSRLNRLVELETMISRPGDQAGTIRVHVVPGGHLYDRPFIIGGLEAMGIDPSRLVVGTDLNMAVTTTHEYQAILRYLMDEDPWDLRDWLATVGRSPDPEVAALQRQSGWQANIGSAVSARRDLHDEAEH